MRIETLSEMPVQKLCTFCKDPATTLYYAHNNASVPTCRTHRGTCHRYCWETELRFIELDLLTTHPFRICPFTKQNPDIQSDWLIGCVVTCTAPAALRHTNGEPAKTWYVVKARGPSMYLLRDTCMREVEITVKFETIPEAMENA
jgi:hypothetical protein